MADEALLQEVRELRQENKKLAKALTDVKNYPREIAKLKSEISTLKSKNRRLNSFLQNGHIVTLDVLVNEFLQLAQQKFSDIYSEILLSEFDEDSINAVEKLIDMLNGYIRELAIFRLDYEADMIAGNPKLELLFDRISNINTRLAMHQVILALPHAKIDELYEILNNVDNALSGYITDDEKG